MSNFAKSTTLPAVGCTQQNIYDLVEKINPTSSVVDTNVLAVSANKITAGDLLPYWRKYTVGHAALQTGALTNNIEIFQLPAGGVLHALKVKTSTAFAGTGITDYKLNVGIAGTLQKFIADYDGDTAVSATNVRVAWAPFWSSLAPAAFVNTDGAISGITLPVFGNVDNAIGSLSVTTSTAYATEIAALRNACETLADDARGLRTAVASLQAACETLADDGRALQATLAALYAGARGFESQSAATSIRLNAVSAGANLSASTAGSLDIWALYSVEA